MPTKNSGCITRRRNLILVKKTNNVKSKALPNHLLPLLALFPVPLIYHSKLITSVPEDCDIFSLKSAYPWLSAPKI